MKTQKLFFCVLLAIVTLIMAVSPVYAAAPSGLAAKVRVYNSTIQVVLTWTDNAPIATAFRIERATGTGSFFPIGITDGRIRKFVDTSVKNGVTYRYRILESSLVSNVITVTPRVYVITTVAGPGGTITPGGTIMAVRGESRAFAIVAKDDFHISAVTDNGYGVKNKLVGRTYTLNNIQRDHVISAKFAKNSVEIIEIPVFRLTVDDDRFWTTDPAEVDMLVSFGWTLEGVAFSAASTGIPVYRLSSDDDDRFWTTNQAEVDMLVSFGWTLEGVAFYAPSTGIPVYRLSSDDDDRFWTTNPAEVDMLVSFGWTLEGEAFKALPPE